MGSSKILCYNTTKPLIPYGLCIRLSPLLTVGRSKVAKCLNSVLNVTRGLFTNDVGIFWGLWHSLVLMSAYHQLLAYPLMLLYTNDDHWKRPINNPFDPNWVQLSLEKPTKAFFGWIPSNFGIFHHSSSFLLTLGPSSSAFVSFLSYRWLFNVATSFVNGP